MQEPEPSDESEIVDEEGEDEDLTLGTTKDNTCGDWDDRGRRKPESVLVKVPWLAMEYRAMRMMH